MCCPALPLRVSCRIAFLGQGEVLWSSHFLEDRLNVLARPSRLLKSGQSSQPHLAPPAPHVEPHRPTCWFPTHRAPADQPGCTCPCLHLECISPPVGAWKPLLPMQVSTGTVDRQTAPPAWSLLGIPQAVSVLLSHRRESLGGSALGYPPILLLRAGFSLKTGLFYYTPGTSTVPGTWQAQWTVTAGMASFEQLRGAADAVSTLVSKAEEGTASQANVPFLSRSSLSGSLGLVKIGCSHKILLLPPPSHLCTFPGRVAIQDERIEVKTPFHLSAARVCRGTRADPQRYPH